MEIPAFRELCRSLSRANQRPLDKGGSQSSVSPVVYSHPREEEYYEEGCNKTDGRMNILEHGYSVAEAVR